MGYRHVSNMSKHVSKQFITYILRGGFGESKNASSLFCEQTFTINNTETESIMKCGPWL